jgi:ribosomal protein S12 methylthiotransferase accessory factor
MVPPELFAKAAEALRGERRIDASIGALLDALDYRAETPGADGEQSGRRAALLSLAGRLDRVFQLSAPSAPGFFFFGAEVRPEIAGPMHAGAACANVTGKGTSLQEAFESCIGEAAEFLSQLETDADALTQADQSAALAQLDVTSRGFVANLLTTSSRYKTDWLAAARLSDGAQAFLPADLILRRPIARRSLEIPFLLGAGTGAGPTPAAALAHALLELVERDALGLWWKGGRRGRAVDLRDPRLAEIARQLQSLRRDRRDRRTWFLDISSDLAVPTVVALSDSVDGGQFAFGSGAALNLAAAARSALLELCQLELAYEIVRQKIRESGQDALNAFDKAHLTRANSIDTDRCELLKPSDAKTVSQNNDVSLSEVIQRAARLGIEIYSTDTTRPSWNIAAVRLIAPALQLEPSEIVTDRLAAAILETGGARKFTGGVPLL